MLTCLGKADRILRGTGDQFKPAGRWDATWKWRDNFDACENNIRAAVGDSSPNRVYATYWNVSGLPGANNNPDDFTNSAKDWISNVYSPLILGMGGSKCRSGLSWFDFYHEIPQIKDIIRSNVGCAGVSKNKYTD